jgi:hypothetical protein
MEEFSSRVSLDGSEVRVVSKNESIVKFRVGVNVCSIAKNQMKFAGGVEALLYAWSASHPGHVSCG